MLPFQRVAGLQDDEGGIVEGKEAVTKTHWVLMTQRKVVQNVVVAKIYIL